MLRSFVRASNTTLEDDNNLRVQEERTLAIAVTREYLARRWHFIPAEEEQLEEELTQLLREGKWQASATTKLFDRGLRRRSEILMDTEVTAIGRLN